MTAKEVITILKQNGWVEKKGGKTGHRQFSHPIKENKVTVSYHTGDIPLLTLKMIAKQAGLKFINNKITI